MRIKLTACETDTGEWKGRRVKKMYSSNFKSMSHKKEQLEVLLIIVFDPGGGKWGTTQCFIQVEVAQWLVPCAEGQLQSSFPSKS